MNHRKLCLLNNMDIEKSKTNQTKFQYQSLVWIKDVLTTSFNDTTFIKGPLIFIMKFISSSKNYSNRVLLDIYIKKLKTHFFIVFIKN